MIKSVSILFRVYFIVLLSFTGNSIYAQALAGTTGLLHAPSAEMQKDKTFMFGGNILHLEPLRYFNFKGIKYTFNYYINVTFFPWLEVGYTCTLNFAEHGSTYFPPQSWGKYTNQDRRFNARLRLWKEGWWKEWTPQIVLGLDDPTSHTSYGGGEAKFDGTGMNNYFTRYYIAATKHFEFKNIGSLGAHSAYVMGRPVHREHYDGVSLGVNFRFNRTPDNLGNKLLNGLNLIAEYDALTYNIGGQYSIWKDRINLTAVLNDGKYFSGGIFFKVHLK